MPTTLEPDLQLPVKPFIFGMFLASIVVSAMGSRSPNFLTRDLPVAFMLLSASMTTWAMDIWLPRFGRAAVIVATFVLALLIPVFYQAPEVSLLLTLPALLAFGLIGLSASMVCAALETILLLGGGWLGVTGPNLTWGMALSLWIWLCQAILWGILERVRILGEWTGQRYLETAAQLEEVRASRQQMAQTTKDLIHANQQLALMNEKLDTARRVAEAAQKAKSAFVANVSHEFRTPLNVILGVIDVLIEKPQPGGTALPAVLFDDLDTIRRNSEHLSTLIGDVLDLSQVESGRMALHKERVQLTDIIQKGLAVVKPLLTRKGLALQLDLAPDLPEIYCDRKRIRQVIINLLSNAARFTQQGGITIAVKHDGINATVSVSDTGPGIAPEDLPHLFQPFGQGENQVPDGISSGLGLSISHQFVALHHGQMWVESPTSPPLAQNIGGPGSTFYFRLPISPHIESAPNAESHLVAEWEWRQRTEPAALALPVLKQRVVIHDETGELAPLLKRQFDELEFLESEKLSAALEALRQEPIRAFVGNTTSIQSLLPLVERAVISTPTGVPVFGYCFPPRGQRVQVAGARDFLIKPITRASLEAVLLEQGISIRRVLVVDDHPDQLNLLRRILQIIQPECAVTTQSSAQHTLDELRQNSYDLLLLDIMMPGLDGWKLLEMKNQDAALRDIPVIIISGNDPDEHPRTSKYFVTTLGDGMSAEQAMRCFETVAGILTD